MTALDLNPLTNVSDPQKEGYILDAARKRRVRRSCAERAYDLTIEANHMKPAALDRSPPPAASLDHLR